MIRVRWIAISFVMRQRCFPHIGMFSFLPRECIYLHEGRSRNKMHLHSTLKGCFLGLKVFDQSKELKTIAKKSLQFYMFPTLDFFVIQTETRFCYMEDGWKVRMNICTDLWSFVNFCCLSQSEVSTDNRKVSTFFAFQHVRCRYCYRSYLDRFLIYNLQSVVCSLQSAVCGLRSAVCSLQMSCYPCFMSPQINRKTSLHFTCFTCSFRFFFSRHSFSSRSLFW